MVGQGCRAGNPDGERIRGAGCLPGDASAWAYLGPEVSRRAGRMPGSRSRVMCLGAGWVPEARPEMRVPQSGSPHVFPLWPCGLCGVRPRRANGRTLDQDSSVLASRPTPSLLVV